MLDDILKREDVLELRENVVNNGRYYDKKNSDSINYQLYVDKEQALFMLYDALIKYKIIIEEEKYLDEFIVQLDKIFKKIDNFKDISFGIDSLIGKFCAQKLNIKYIEDAESRERILQYIYNKYIEEGYFVHGYSSYYENTIKNEGFDPENYINYYQEFQEINKIFEKYNIGNILEKDFTKKIVHFTDSIMLGCYYSINSPGYFYNLLMKSQYSLIKYRKDAYLKDSRDACIKNLKRLFSVLDITEDEKRKVLDIVQKEWDLLHTVPKKISLMFVKRKLLDIENNIKLERIINDKNITIYEAVSKILAPRKDRVLCWKKINKEDIIFLDLDFYKEEIPKKVIEEEEDDVHTAMIMNEFRNVYGKVSALLLVGSLLITLGVLITIVIICRGL